MHKRAALAALAAIALAVAFLLTGCGGGATAAQSNATSASQTTPTTSPDIGALKALCAQYCDDLRAQSNVCPMGTVNLIGCDMPLAQGADKVLAVQKGLASVNSTTKDVPDLLVSIAKAQDAYQKWEDASCLVADVNDASYAEVYPGGKTAIVMCQLDAQMVSTTQSTVGIDLYNAANGK